MKKLFLFLVTIAVTAMMVSCGDNFPQEKILTVDNINIYGTSKEALRALPGDYTLKVVGDEIVLPVKFELYKEYIPITRENDIREWSTEPRLGNISLVLLDASGIQITDIYTDFHPASGNYDKISDLLQSEVGTVYTILFKWSAWSPEKYMERIMTDAVSFEITKADYNSYGWDKNSSKQSENAAISANIQETNNGTSEWDDLLDSYEDYVEDYIELLKEIQNGNNSVMDEYLKTMQSGSKLEEQIKVAEASGDMSANQAVRWTTIQIKFVEEVNKINY